MYESKAFTEGLSEFFVNKDRKSAFLGVPVSVEFLVSNISKSYRLGQRGRGPSQDTRVREIAY